MDHICKMADEIFLSLSVMVTSSKGNLFRVTGTLHEESTSYQWIPLTKASEVKFWCSLSSELEQIAK